MLERLFYLFIYLVIPDKNWNLSVYLALVSDADYLNMFSNCMFMANTYNISSKKKCPVIAHVWQMQRAPKANKDETFVCQSASSII